MQDTRLDFIVRILAIIIVGLFCCLVADAVLEKRRKASETSQHQTTQDDSELVCTCKRK